MPMENRVTQKFVILTSARSGSNMLKSLLDSHPHVECLGEIFNPAYGPGYANWSKRSSVRRLLGRLAHDHNVERYLDFISTKASTKTVLAARGFKVMYPGQFHRCGIFPRYWQEHDFKVVRLTRRNLLRRYVSAKIASIENIWSAKENRGMDIKIKVDIEDLHYHLLRMETLNKSIDALAREFPHLFVDYEDLIEDQACSMRRIFQFLGTDEGIAAEIRASTARQNSGPLQAIVENYDAVCEALEGGPYARFIEAEPASTAD